MGAIEHVSIAFEASGFAIGGVKDWRDLRETVDRLARVIADELHVEYRMLADIPGDGDWWVLHAGVIGPSGDDDEFHIRWMPWGPDNHLFPHAKDSGLMTLALNVPREDSCTTNTPDDRCSET